MCGKIMADEFTNLYQCSKTLRFELKPIGRTLEYIERDEILKTDNERGIKYQKAKSLIDEYHKDFINEALRNVHLEGLNEYNELYLLPKRDEKQEKSFNDIQTSLRKQIVKCFTSHTRYKNLNKKELIKNDMVEFLKDRPEDKSLISEFADFTTYFTGFNTNRQNMYSEEDKSTAIAYRIIHQNLPKYIDNIKVFEILKENNVDLDVSELKKILNEKYGIDSIEKYFELDGFNNVITQSGIDKYNTIVGGVSQDNDIKIKGINECINLYNQKNKTKLPKMKMLYKQILSDREGSSFVLDNFETGEEVIKAVNEFYEMLYNSVIDNANEISIRELISDINSYDLENIYVSNDTTITTISQYLFDDWSIIKNAISTDYDNLYMNKNVIKNLEKYNDTKIKNLKRQNVFSIDKLNKITEEYTGGKVNIQSYFTLQIDEKINAIRNTYREYENQVANSDYSKLNKNQNLIEKLKNFLDAIKDLQALIKPLIKGQDEAQKDEIFYVELIRLNDEIDKINPLYNKVRNYITKKPYSTEKVRINFDKSTLLDGWDRNKEKDNLGVIFIKDDLYYLGIMNRNSNKVMEEAPKPITNDTYQKMEYKYTKDVTTTVPKCSTQLKKVKAHFTQEDADYVLSDDTFLKPLIITRKVFDLNNVNYEGQKKFQVEYLRRTGDAEGYTDALVTWIDFCKEFLVSYKSTAIYNYDSLKPSDQYKSLDEFYGEVNNKLYMLSFRQIDKSYIDELVDNGQMYLFQIYNKDFSPYSKGTPNLHTMYWKMLFAPENLKNVVYKLNGQAEIFYRKRSIAEDEIIKHNANEILRNKYPLAIKKTSQFDYEIIKDKRFTVDKFQFHVPITQNFQAKGEKYINSKVRRTIHDSDNIHIIGIDRGERNLLYLCVIDMQGNIVKQLSLNKIITKSNDGADITKNYHMLLDKRENENLSARQNWQTINSIKELKEGYLSQVIHLISKLTIEYNAIVVLEDLNFGFMRSRQKFEKQVYQKFEKMLIDKLNYLVDKSKVPNEMGGLLNAYQLTDKFESFQNMGKQSGFLFYVPAWNTSKIDPTTGFVNLFNTKYETKEKSREFINKFKYITYVNADNNSYFEFNFDYTDFTYKAEGSRTQWCICTEGDRIETYRNPQKNNEWDTRKINLTGEFKSLFDKYSIEWTKDNLIAEITNIDETEFYRSFMHLMSLVLQIRNSNENEDWILSPVKNSRGKFFNTNQDEPNYPKDADANGAYNIAKKGLWIVEQIKNSDIDKLDKVKLAISNKEWLAYAQEHTLNG
jgi:CRISPR-associated protein Cpf1